MKGYALIVLACALACTYVRPAEAQERRAELSRLFPHEAAVSVPAGQGLSRLRLPPEVLAETRGDLADVRLFDAAGNEVPFLLDSARRPLWLRHERVERAPGRLVAVEQHHVWHRGPLYHEELTIETPREPSPSGSWDLVFDVRRTHFVSQVEVFDRSNVERTLARGSLFRLKNPLREGVRLALPSDLPKRITIVIDGDQHYLEPALYFDAARAPAATRLRLPLAELSRDKTEGATTLLLDRPRGIVPDRVEIATDTGTFYRNVEVYDAGQNGGASLGTEALFRVSDLRGVASLGVWIDPPSGDRLRVVIDDGDSPALAGLSVVAVVDQPALVFELTGRGVLRYGGGRAHAPGYDLARMIGTGVGEALALRGAMREATLGTRRDNAAFDPAPALGFLMRPGSAVDLARYSHRQRIEVPPSSEGLAQLRLGAEELARLRADLGDLRLVDDDGRQLPYLLERTEDLRVSLIVAAPVAHEGESHYQLSLPATPLTLVSIDVAPAAPYVDRPYRLVSGSGDDAITIAAGNLRRRPGTPDDLRIAIPSVGRERFDQLTLIVDDGDDAALAITGAQAEVATADVFVVAPAGFHWLLLGDPAAEPPRYELHSARDLVLAVTSAAVKRGALEPNPGYAPAAPSDPRGPVVLLWIVLAAAVLILGAITLRAARTTPPAQTPEVE